MASNAENVSIWWHHHVVLVCQHCGGLHVKCYIAILQLILTLPYATIHMVGIYLVYWYRVHNIIYYLFHIAGACVQRIFTDIRGWIGNDIRWFMWDVIIHPCPKPQLNLGPGWIITSQCFTWMQLLNHTFISMLVSLIFVRKRDALSHMVSDVHFLNVYFATANA